MKKELQPIAIYSRKSKFTGKGESVGNQVELCREYIRTHFGDEAAEKAIVFEDEGFSGGNINRPAFKKMMAHIERYLPLQSGDVWTKLLECGVLMQVNASFFRGFGDRRKALTLLRKGGIHAIGSDCHNVEARPPKMQEAFSCIEKKMGTDYLHQMDAFGQDLLELSQ